MEENKRTLNWRIVLPELAALFVTVSGVLGFSIIKALSQEITLRNMVMSALGIAVLGFALRQEYCNHTLDYNNEEHLMRFWCAFAVGLLIAFICVFLPSGGWPFLAVFVMLSLFSNLNTGILAASALLMIPVLLSDATAGVFFLYFVSGVFAAGLFRKLENEFMIGLPMALSLMCLLLCETANIVLLANERLSIELLVIPVVNLILSSIMLLGILKFFSGAVVYQYREYYLELNDTENAALLSYKQSDRAEYFACVHIAYFCERIANKLGLHADALKCAAYYHKKGMEIIQEMDMHPFPPEVDAILQDFQKRKSYIVLKETAVLLCADAIINSMMYMLAKSGDKELDYDQIIDALFKRLQDGGTFNYCDITMKELRMMQKIFKEEKLYYDFLR